MSSQIKSLFAAAPNNDGLVKSRPALQKINNPKNMEECYWKAKEYQRKESRFNEKIGYEVVSVIIDKMIKHNLIFTLSNPTPSEADTDIILTFESSLHF